MKKVLLAAIALVILGAGVAAFLYLRNEAAVTEFGGQSFGDGARTVEIPPRSGPKAVATQRSKTWRGQWKSLKS